MNTTQILIEADTVATRAHEARRPVDRVHLFKVASALYKAAGKEEEAKLVDKLASIIAKRGEVR